MIKFVRLFRKLIIAISLLVVIVVAALTAILMTVDPNRLKPAITDALAKQGIEAKFNGDLSWSFYPVVGVSVERFQLLGSSSSNESLAELGNLVLGIKLMPLMQKKLEVQTVLVEDAHLHYVIDQNGQSNWQSFLDTLSSQSQATTDEDTTTSSPQDTDQEADSQETSFHIARIELRNAKLSYTDQVSHSHSEINELGVLIKDFDSNASFFPINFGATISHNDISPIRIDIQSSLQLDLKNGQMTLQKAQADISSKTAKARMLLDGKAGWGEETSAQFTINLLPLSPENWAKAINISLPERAGEKTLRHAALQTTFAMKGQSVSLPDTRIELDDIRLTGATDIRLSDSGLPSVKTRWQSNALNVDNYLPPSSSDEEVVEPAPVEETQPQPLPTAMLRELDIDAALNIDSLTVVQQTLDDIKLSVTARNGIINAKIANASTFDATLKADTRLDARKDRVTLQANASTTGLNIGKLMNAIADLDNITGMADTTITVTGAGKTDRELADSIDAHIETRSEHLSLNPINIEQAYCKLVALADNKPLPEKEWPALTNLTPIKVNLRYHNNLVDISTLSAEIDRLSTSATGKLDLESGRFDVPIDISMANFSAAQNACAIVDEKWRNRIIPLRCKGSLEKISYDTCTPDMKRLGDLAKQRLQQEKRKVEAKAEKRIDEEREKVKDRIDEKAKQLLKKQEGKGLGGGLNRLLNR